MAWTETTREQYERIAWLGTRVTLMGYRFIGWAGSTLILSLNALAIAYAQETRFDSFFQSGDWSGAAIVGSPEYQCVMTKPIAKEYHLAVWANYNEGFGIGIISERKEFKVSEDPDIEIWFDRVIFPIYSSEVTSESTLEINTWAEEYSIAIPMTSRKEMVIRSGAYNLHFFVSLEGVDDAINDLGNCVEEKMIENNQQSVMAPNNSEDHFDPTTIHLPTAPLIGRCHMGSCSWGIIVSISQRDLHQSNRSYNLRLLGGISHHYDNSKYPQNYLNSINIEWHSSTHDVKVICNDNNPTVSMDGQEINLNFNMIPSTYESYANLYVQICYGAEPYSWMK